MGRERGVERRGPLGGILWDGGRERREGGPLGGV